MKPKYVWMRPILALAAMAGLLFLVVRLTLYGLTDMNKEAAFIFGILVQAIIGMALGGFGFYFGTSQGSANKAETIDEILRNGTPPESPDEQN